MTALASRFTISGDVRCFAGEALTVELAFDTAGTLVDLTGREWAWTVYRANDREPLFSAAGEVVSVGDDRFVRFAIDGDTTDELFARNRIGLRHEMAEVTAGGRDVWVEGQFSIARSAAAVSPAPISATAGSVTRFVFDYQTRRVTISPRGAPGMPAWQALGLTEAEYRAEQVQAGADAGEAAGASAGAAAGATAGADAGATAGEAAGGLAGAAAGASAAQPAVDAANTAASEANIKAAYAGTQGDYAKGRGEAAQAVVDAGATILAAKDVAVDARDVTTAARDVAVTAAGDASTAVSGRVLSVTVRRSQRTPLARDNAGNVPLWLEDGMLGALGLSPRLIKQTGATLGVDQANPRSTFLLPIARDSSGNVALWLDNGALGARALSPILQRAIVAGIPFTPLSASPSAGQSILRTDGRSLWSWRARVATLESGQPIPLRLGLTGDSWIDQMRIPLAVSALAFAQWGRSGDGWISIGSQRVGAIGNNPVGYTLSHTGSWATFDGAPSSGSAIAMPATGIGPDGYAATVTTATATYKIANVTATRLRIFYFDNDATFRWRVDGGAWTVVAGASTNTRQVVTIDGLTDAAHTLDIDTTGNTSTLSLHGFTAERPAAGGVTLFQMGNGDAAGVHYTSMASQIAGFSGPFALDVLAIILGTNDHNRTLGTAQYVQGLTDIITAHRSANPELPVILVAPAQGGLARTPTMATYRDAARDLAKTLGCEFVSLTDSFGPYASENARGQWTDASHLSDIGARRAAAAIFAMLKG